VTVTRPTNNTSSTGFNASPPDMQDAATQFDDASTQWKTISTTIQTLSTSELTANDATASIYDFPAPAFWFGIYHSYHASLAYHLTLAKDGATCFANTAAAARWNANNYHGQDKTQATNVTNTMA
jgi:hypothetical protein